MAACCLAKLGRGAAKCAASRDRRLSQPSLGPAEEAGPSCGIPRPCPGAREKVLRLDLARH
ncbi:hypothetical protein CEE87_12460, partial [Lactobacillus crispatus]